MLPLRGPQGFLCPLQQLKLIRNLSLKGLAPLLRPSISFPWGAWQERWVAVMQEEKCTQEWWRPGHAGISLPYGPPPPVRLSVAVAWPLTPGLSSCGRYWEGDSSSLAPDVTTEERRKDTQMTRIQDPFKSTSSIFLLRKDYIEL